MRSKFLSLFFLMLAPFVASASPPDSFFIKADSFFKKYVEGGSVAYSRVKQNFREVEALYSEIATTDLKNETVETKKAFYINAYNIVVIYWVVKHYPLKSPLDDSGFFDKIKHTVAGEQLTLNSLEVRKLLQPYKDARFHFALACAAKSCPPLASFAYQPGKLDEQLNNRTKTTLNDNEWIKVYPKQKKLALSKIFEWYKTDFTQHGETVIAWINQYRKEKISESYTIEYYEYNWALNDMK